MEKKTNRNFFFDHPLLLSQSLENKSLHKTDLIAFICLPCFVLHKRSTYVVRLLREFLFLLKICFFKALSDISIFFLD